MKVKKPIPLFLVLLLSIQFLPLQRIAAWLSSGQVTEDITHGLDSGKSKSLLCEKDPAVLAPFFNTSSNAALTAVTIKYYSTESLWTRDADEILIPPPNE